MWGNKVECPYCERENDVSDALQDLDNDNKTDWECGYCGEEFELQAEFEPTWGASKIEYVECECCGDVSREFKRRGKVIPYPETYKENVLCESCWRAGVLADMKGAE
ncbi:hypothetical protein ACTHOQ_14215 [Solibacillus silvestris]|uniref:hypothetical protein n=1 Tax=Solibacillus silvestris TaxID=76853 RepID=UPI003F81C4B0